MTGCVLYFQKEGRRQIFRVYLGLKVSDGKRGKIYCKMARCICWNSLSANLVGTRRLRGKFIPLLLFENLEKCYRFVHVYFKVILNEINVDLDLPSLIEK